MILLINLIIVFGVVCLLHKEIKKYAKIIYSLLALLAFGLIIMMPVLTIGVFNSYQGLEILASPHAATAMFILVAIASGVKGKFPQLIRVRTELSVIGFMLLSTHIVSEILLELSYKTITLVNYGLFAAILMIPLFVTSFKHFKIKLKANWKKLHSISYAVYFLMFMHLIYIKDMPAKEVEIDAINNGFVEKTIFNNADLDQYIYIGLLGMFIVVKIIQNKNTNTPKPKVETSTENKKEEN